MMLNSFRLHRGVVLLNWDTWTLMNVCMMELDLDRVQM